MTSGNQRNVIYKMCAFFPFVALKVNLIENKFSVNDFESVMFLNVILIC